MRIGSFRLGDPYMLARWLAACIVLAGVFVAACGSDGERSVTGVIIVVEAPSLAEIDSFTLRDKEGQAWVFQVAPDAAQDLQEGFFPSHLRSHAALGEEVKVFYREEGETLLALRMEHP